MPINKTCDRRRNLIWHSQQYDEFKRREKKETRLFIDVANFTLLRFRFLDSYSLMNILLLMLHWWYHSHLVFICVLSPSNVRIDFLSCSKLAWCVWDYIYTNTDAVVFIDSFQKKWCSSGFGLNHCTRNGRWFIKVSQVYEHQTHMASKLSKNRIYRPDKCLIRLC